MANHTKLFFRFKEVDRDATEREFRELFILSRDRFEFILKKISENNIFNKIEHLEIYSLHLRNIVAGIILVMTSSTTILDISFKVGMSHRSLQIFSDTLINYLLSVKDELISFPDLQIY